MIGVVPRNGRKPAAAGGPAKAAERQFVSFWVDGQLLGIPVSAVQEVLGPQQIAAVPLARPEIAGLLNLRGQIVTAVDLRRRLGLPARADGSPMNVVVRHDGECFSLLADDIGDVIDAPADAFEPPPRTLAARYRSVTSGVFRLEDKLFVILDVGTLLTLG